MKDYKKEDVIDANKFYYNQISPEELEPKEKILLEALISKILELRKEEGLKPEDNIHIRLTCDNVIEYIMYKYMERIKAETHASHMEYFDDYFDRYDLIGHSTGIKIYKMPV